MALLPSSSKQGFGYHQISPSPQRKPQPGSICGFFVSVEVREDPTETAVYWYTDKRIPIPCMARTTRPLTHTKVQKAKALDKELTLRNGDGLFCWSIPPARKFSVSAIKLPNRNKRTTISLSAYPFLSLADAREIRAEKLAMLVRGIDPQARADKEAEKL